MRKSEFDDSLLGEFLDHIEVPEARRGAQALIAHAERHPLIACAPTLKGVIRDFQYHVAGKYAFAFIFNKSSALFYVRLPALKWPGMRTAIESFTRQSGLELRTNRSGESTVSVAGESDAQWVISLLVDAILGASDQLTSFPTATVTRMPNLIRRPAALVRQGQLRLYTTSMQAQHLLVPGFYDIERLDPANVHDKGYQRVLNTARAKRLADYLVAGQENHDAFLPTSIFLATDKDLAFDDERNILDIDLAKVGSFSVVDGQHRLEGLRVAAEKDPRIGTFEVPVNIAVGLSKIAQMCHFLIVNTTQKSVDKAVEQRLIARLTEMVEVEDVPTLPKWIRRVVESGDDAQALRLIDYLNQTPGSPWERKIEMPNTYSEETTVSQKSFVIAVKKYVLAASNPLAIRPMDQQEKIFLNYWRAIADELGTDEETVLFKSIGVDLFCRFSGTVFGKLQNKFSVETIRGLLRRTFDHLDGDYAGLGQPDWWLSGSGPAGGLNASALGKINQELARALHRAEDSDSIDL